MNPRIAFAALLLAAPLLYAQDEPQKIEAQKLEITLAPAKQDAPPQKETPAVREPYRITITFKTTDGGKTTTQRNYTLVSTTGYGEASVRDESQIYVKSPDGFNIRAIHTNVDMRNFNKSQDEVYFTLSIDTTTLAGGPTVEDPSARAITHNNRYAVSPTLAIGKRTVVYSAVDAVNDTKVDVEVLVEPLNAK